MPVSTDVQTMADLDDNTPRALRTPLYPAIAVLGLIMVISTFLTWASAENPDDGSISQTVSGLDAGGWGLSALIVGAIIAALGVLGYFWNPFSDPEAMFIAGFSLAVLVGAIAKLVSPDSLFADSEEIVDYFDASAGIGVWLVLLSALLALVAAAWILFDRPRAEARL